MNTKRYRHLLLSLAAGAGLIAIGACAAPTPTADPGDTAAAVTAKLGKPQGSITRGKVTTYYYDRGLVNFVDGRVQSSTLVTPEEAARIRREQDEAARVRREQIDAQQQAVAMGLEERATHRTDAAFLARPAAARQAYWDDFHKRYPDIDISADLAEVQTGADAESRKKQEGDDLKALRPRIEAIRARLAQLDADYTASRTTWKRNEITAERTRLMAELDAALNRSSALPGDSRTGAVTNRPASGP